MSGVVGTLARCYPGPVDPDERFVTALSFLGVDLPAATVLQAGYGASLLVALSGTLCGPLVPVRWRPLWLLAVVLAAGLLATGVRTVPLVAATARRTSALGAAPGLVSRAVMRMHFSPAPEAAAAFAAETGRGRLAASLTAHVHRTRTAPDSALDAFGSEWATWFPALQRALTLVEVAGATPETQRERTLDRALETVLSGTEDATASFAATVKGPATALYAFGVLLPLSLVALVPAAGVAGVPVTPLTLVLVYDVALPLVVLAAGAWLLARRPVTFPATAIDRSHPDVPATPWRAVGAGVAVGAAVGILAWQTFARWTVPLAVFGGGVGTALLVRFRPAMAVRRRVDAVEADLADALALVARHVQRGNAVETAIEATGTDLSGETAAVFAAAARHQRQLGAGVRESFLGDHGALSKLPSPRARGVAVLLSLAAVEGRAAGDALASMADHLDDLGRVEAQMRRTLAQITGTLTNTAAVFAPLVGGATVALSDSIGPSLLSSGGSVPATPVLGLTVGGYVLVLSVLLAGLAAGLERGFDRTLVGYRAGGALLAATAVFLSTVSLVGQFV